jgi:DNA-binding transcriptional regulator YiaG
VKKKKTPVRRGPSLATVLQSDLRQVAARATRALDARVRRLHRQARALKRTSLDQRRGLARLERGVERLRDRGRPGLRTASGPGVSPAAIRALRARMGMTRERFARHLGVSPGSIFLWETGRARPRAASAARLRLATGRSPGPGRPRKKRAAGRGAANRPRRRAARGR